MTPDEVMAEIKGSMSQTGIVLGNLTRFYGGWDILLSNGSWAVLQEKDARRYLIGFLQEWYADNYEMIDDFIYGLASCISKQAEDGKPMERGLVPMIDMYDDRGFLPALWEAYKAVEKIEVS